MSCRVSVMALNWILTSYMYCKFDFKRFLALPFATYIHCLTQAIPICSDFLTNPRGCLVTSGRRKRAAGETQTFTVGGKLNSLLSEFIS